VGDVCCGSLPAVGRGDVMLDNVGLSSSNYRPNLNLQTVVIASTECRGGKFDGDGPQTADREDPLRMADAWLL